MIFTLYGDVNDMEDKNDNRGGYRKGSGRKPNEIPKKRRSVYCTTLEYQFVKEALSEIRKINAAWKEVSKYKGQEIPHQEAVLKAMNVEKEVKNVTLGFILDKLYNETMKK